MGRTGLGSARFARAWGVGKGGAAGGPGPGRLGSGLGVNFQKVQYLIVFNLKSESPILIMTAFYSVFEFYPKSVLLHLGTSRARLEKRHSHSAQFFLGAPIIYIFKIFKIWNHIF